MNEQSRTEGNYGTWLCYSVSGQLQNPYFLIQIICNVKNNGDCLMSPKAYVIIGTLLPTNQTNNTTLNIK